MQEVPSEAAELNTKGQRLVVEGKLDEALVALSEAIVLAPGYVNAYLNRADVLEKLERHAEARADRQTARALTAAAPAAQTAAPAAQPVEARRAARLSSLALALPHIESDVRRRADTDRQMSFWGNLLATFGLAAITFYIGGLIWSWVFHYRLVERRNQHFERQRSFYGRVAEALRQHGRDMNNDELVATANRAQALLDEAAAAEPQRSPWLWGVILPPLTFGIAMLYTYWFLMADFRKHSLLQVELSETVGEGLGLATGEPISIVDQSAVPQRNFWLYLVLSMLFFVPIFVWVYRIFDDPNKHFAQQELTEGQILVHLRALA